MTTLLKLKKNITRTLLMLLILLPASTYSQSGKDTTTSSDTQEWTKDEIQLMEELIPLLYKDVLRLDSCVAVSEIKDSMVVKLNEIIDSHEISSEMKDYIIQNLNLQIEEFEIIMSRHDGNLKLVRKKSFWNGFKFGYPSGIATVLLIIIFV